jgi:MoaA/NifB/PqqE/SkfB family radical SAM enzyme
MKLSNIAEYSKNYINIKKGLKTPLYLILFVSDKCNLKCRHCFWWKERKNYELNIEEYEKISKTLKNPLETLHITGGESFIRNDIVEICKIFTKTNKTKNIIISTNGTLTDTILKHVKEILKFQPNLNINISLDGLEKTHDKIRGVKGTFQKACQTIKDLKKINVNVSVVSVLTNENEKEVFELADFVKKTLCVNFYCEIVRGNPRISTVKAPKYNPKFLEVESCSGALEKFQKYTMKLKFDVLAGKGNFKCIAGNYIGVVYSNGDVATCELIKPFGNLKQTDFDFYRLWIKKNKIPKNCYCTHGCFLNPSVYYSKKIFTKIKL